MRAFFSLGCARYGSASQSRRRDGGANLPSSSLRLERLCGLPSVPASNRCAICGSNKFRSTEEKDTSGCFQTADYLKRRLLRRRFYHMDIGELHFFNPYAEPRETENRLPHWQ